MSSAEAQPVRRLLWLAAFALIAGCDLITSPVQGDNRVRDVGFGGDFTCAVTEDGRTYCWGDNRSGQLGLGDTLPALTPRYVATGVPLNAIYPAALSFCGIDPRSRLHCWEANEEHRLNAVADIISDELRYVVEGSDIGVDETWNLWGLDHGALDTRKPLAPRQIVAKVMAVYDEGPLPDGSGETPRYHGCALTTTGEAFCEGTNRYGELGIGPDEPADYSSRPYQAVLAEVRFRSLYAAAAHTCGISISDELYCWGRGYGPLPLKLMPGTHFISMDAGAAQNCAVTSSGEGLCWNPENQENFREVAPAIRFRKIIVTSNDPYETSPFPRTSSVCGISVEGALYCWGSNPQGQLGTGTRMDEATPVRIVIRD